MIVNRTAIYRYDDRSVKKVKKKEQKCIDSIFTLFLPFSPLFLVDALEPKIDLLEALNLRSNISRYTGIRATAGSEMTKRAYHLMSESINFFIQ